MIAAGQPRTGCAEQSRNIARAKILRFPALARKHCSIDLSFSFARGARRSRKLKSTGNSRVTIPLAERLFFPAFRSAIATASGDTFITKHISASAPPPAHPLIKRVPLQWRAQLVSRFPRPNACISSISLVINGHPFFALHLKISFPDP